MSTLATESQGLKLEDLAELVRERVAWQRAGGPDSPTEGRPVPAGPPTVGVESVFRPSGSSLTTDTAIRRFTLGSTSAVRDQVRAAEKTVDQCAGQNVVLIAGPEP